MRQLAWIICLLWGPLWAVPALAAPAGAGGPLAAAGPAAGLPPILRGVGIEQRLGQRVPLDLTFRDETGRTVRLGDYFGDRPVVLTLAYYECPMLCSQVLGGLAGSLKGLSLDMGRDFQVVTVSFDPRDTPERAAGKKRDYAGRYGRGGKGAAWHFLTGDGPAIAALTRAAGFHYAYDDKARQYAHPSGIMVLTPDGRLSHYFLGIDYPPRDLRLSLVEASAGHIGTPVDRLLLFCFHYDPATGRYGPAILAAVRIGGALTLGCLLLFLSYFIVRDLRG